MDSGATWQSKPQQSADVLPARTFELSQACLQGVMFGLRCQQSHSDDLSHQHEVTRMMRARHLRQALCVGHRTPNPLLQRCHSMAEQPKDQPGGPRRTGDALCEMELATAGSSLASVVLAVPWWILASMRWRCHCSATPGSFLNAGRNWNLSGPG